MTRRVVIAIVINVWLVLVTAGCYTYFVARSLLIADLDDAIVSRVASLPGIQRPESLPRSAPDAHDRYVIRDQEGRMITSLANGPAGKGPPPLILKRDFTPLADGTRLRTLVLRAFAQPASGEGPFAEVTIVYSASAQHLDQLLHELSYALAFFGLLAAAATGVAAQSIARAALRPLVDAAAVIGRIDERSLDRRIEVGLLPKELHTMGHQLNDMLGRLQSAFAARRQFLADASHELRTPVAALVTSLEVGLRRRRDSVDYARVLERCLSDARLLHQLVVALVDQARAERFDGKADLGPVAVSQVLKQCLSQVQTVAGEKNVLLTSRIPENLVVLADEMLLRSAVGNLLSNAVEYTGEAATDGQGRVLLLAEVGEWPAGQPRAEIPEGLQATPCRLIIQVEDNGPGIGPKHLPHIFEPFYRVNESRTDSSQHMGLGLSLVRSKCRGMGGDCTVLSPVPGQTGGCRFTIELLTVQMSSDNVAEFSSSEIASIDRGSP